MNADSRPGGSDAPLPRLIAVLLTAAFAAILVRTAWIGDDMLISFRAVLNVTHGFGLLFNIGERVQAFTHPLWVGLVTLVYLISGNLLLGTLLLSVALSLVVFWLAVSRARSAWQAATVAIVLVLSNAFVDYSTSGLENPLSHLLILWLVWLAIRHQQDSSRALTGFGLLASLLYLTRPDLVILAVPFLLSAAVSARRLPTILRSTAIGAAPAVLWTLFSLLYYGFPFPNTAYAKLGSGVETGSRWLQGTLYLFDSIDRDPLTMVTIVFAVAMSVTAAHRVGRLLALGIAFYLLYVVSIGGDFMTGRFLSAPLLAAVLVLGWIADRPRTVWMVSTALLLGIGMTAAHVPPFTDSRFDDAGVRRNGIVNERGVFFKERSLVRADRRTFRNPGWPMNTGAAARPRVVQVCGLAGIAGIDQGPYVHVLDECALTDPLLARLPAMFNDQWRIGHFRRAIPEGYEQSLVENSNRLTDLHLREFYDRLRLITRSSRLLDPARLRAIVGMNTGRYDHLIDVRLYRHERAVASLDALSVIRDDGTPADAPGVLHLSGPLAVTATSPPGRRFFEVSLDADDGYRLTFLQGNHNVGTVDLGPTPEHRRPAGLATYYGDVPPDAVQNGFDVIVVAPTSGGGRYAIGHLLVEGNAATDAALRARRIRVGERVD